MASAVTSALCATWSLKRWLLTCIGAMAAVLVVGAALMATTYGASDNAHEAARHAVAAQTELERHLRGLNEAVLSEGSSSAVQLARDSAGRFDAEIALLAEHTVASPIGLALETQVRPAWERVSATSKALLALKGLSASDDDSMLAYGKVVGLSEEVVRAVAEIERQADATARAAERRLVLLGAACGVGGVAALLLMGTLIYRVVFARLGGEPALACEMATRLAAYDLTVNFPPVKPGTTGTVMVALQQIRDSLVEVVAQVRQNSESVATASAQIASGNNDLSQRTGQQSSLLGQAASSMQQLGGTVQRNVEHAVQADELARRASSVAEKGGSVVRQVVETMNGINDSSGRIADIIGVIDSIAFQTNILALNAAVEAARAGEQGRGFAVVASEVRSLAHRSADAAKEIKTLIGTSVDRVAQGTALVDEAGATMAEIVSSIQRVTEIVGQISQASREQTAEVGQVGAAVGDMDRATQQNAALVEESAAAADSLRQQAQQLVQAVAVFRLRPA